MYQVFALSFFKENNWSGMYLKSPFGLPNCVLTFAVDGVRTLDLPNSHAFPLKTDVGEEAVYEGLEKHIESHKFGRSSKKQRVVLSEGVEDAESIFGKLEEPKDDEKYNSVLKGNVEQRFLDEISLLNEIAKSVGKNKISEQTKDVVWMKITGLHGIVDVHGENSTETREAKRLLAEAITDVSDAFNKAYNGKILASVIVSDAMHTRRIRAATQTDENGTSKKEDDINLAKNYDRNYPAIFNIILWFGVSMFFSLLAICIFISTMDPGRDSIIYRMTSTRMKKDN